MAIGHYDSDGNCWTIGVESQSSPHHTIHQEYLLSKIVPFFISLCLSRSSIRASKEEELFLYEDSLWL